MVEDTFHSRELCRAGGDCHRPPESSGAVTEICEGAPMESTQLVETVLADGNYDQVPFGKILQILHRHRGIERAQQQRSVEILEPLVVLP